jgi:hypothetical protein
VQWTIGIDGGGQGYWFRLTQVAGQQDRSRDDYLRGRLFTSSVRVLTDAPPHACPAKHAGLGISIWLTRLTEPHVLFPALTLLVLSIIWGATFNLIKVECANAVASSSVAARELVDTYAQVVRALREIDRSLKLVKYAYKIKGVRALSELKAQRTAASGSVLRRDDRRHPGRSRC